MCLFLREGEIGTRWRKGSSSVLWMKKERSPSVHEQKSCWRQSSPRISCYNSWKLTRVDCLLFTVHKCWQKAQQEQDKWCLLQLRSVMTSVMAMGKGAPEDVPTGLCRVSLPLQVRTWLMELAHRIVLLIILSFDEGGPGRLSYLDVVHKWVCIWGWRLEFVSEHVRAGFVSDSFLGPYSQLPFPGDMFNR